MNHDTPSSWSHTNNPILDTAKQCVSPYPLRIQPMPVLFTLPTK